MTIRLAKLFIIFILCILVLALGIFSMTGCGDKYSAPAAIVGNWTCEDIASDQITDTSFYSLSVKEDGSFSLSDYVSGNPGISGSMYCDDTGNLGIINIECDEADFNPPACWSISREARLRYKALSKDKIRLGYCGIWMTFNRD